MRFYLQKIRTLFCFIACSLFIFSIGFGDVIYLKNGRKVTGDIVSETETLISVKTILGRVVVKQKDIVKIQREEAETNHVRNGDYLVNRGEFNAAVGEYEAALRLDPTNSDVALKLSDAKQKAAQAVSAIMAPDFAKADDFMSKGFYNSAIREYRTVAKQHEDNPTYDTEANIKIKNLANIMVTKAEDLASRQDYNKAFEIYQQSTAILPSDLAEFTKEKYDGALSSFFADADKAYDKQQYASAVLAYNKAATNYPGEFVRQAVSDRISRISVDLTYKAPVEDVSQYLCRAQFVSDPEVVARLGNAPGNFQNMEYVLDNTYRVTGIAENGNIDMDWTVNKTSFTILDAQGQKQTIPVLFAESQNITPGYGFSYLTKKMESGEITPLGYFSKPIDLAKIIHSKGLTGERMDQNSFTGTIFLLSRFPVVQPKKVKVGDTWTEQVNEKRNIGPLELNTVGEINYTLSSFEIMQGRDCAKLAINMKMTHTLKGTIGGLSGQQQNVDVTLDSPFSGFCYIDHFQKKLVQYDVTGEVKMKGQILGIQSVIPQGIMPGLGTRRGGGEGGGLGGGILAPQVQSQQELPEVSIKVVLQRDLLEANGETGTPFSAPVPVTPLLSK